MTRPCDLVECTSELLNYFTLDRFISSFLSLFPDVFLFLGLRPFGDNYRSPLSCTIVLHPHLKTQDAPQSQWSDNLSIRVRQCSDERTRSVGCEYLSKMSLQFLIQNIGRSSTLLH
ncbi:hypothetical protein M758_UG064600 [Ceratodon purpureus]|nr:hypothetical protein M758_UG064600 [Ceratodon purpureus]